jgi:hypothetical protein
MRLSLTKLPTEAIRLFSMEQNGERRMPLTFGAPLHAELRSKWTSELFCEAYSPAGALAGIHLYCDDFSGAHAIAQDLASPEGSLWHAIVHRREPDDFNAGYWFRRVSGHPIYAQVASGEASVDYYAAARADRKLVTAAEDRQWREWTALMNFCLEGKLCA